MALFIKPIKIGEVCYRNCDLKNNPINIDNCISFSKNQYRWYPDNDGIPSIEFKMNFLNDKGENAVIEWKYNRVTDRDEDYENILNKFSGA